MLYLGWKVRWPFLGPIWKLLEIAVESCGVRGWIDGAHGWACVHVYTGVCLRPGEDTGTPLCVLGSYLNKSCQDEWFSLASPDAAAFACPSGTMFLASTCLSWCPFSLLLITLPKKSGYQRPGPRTPPPEYYLLPRKPFRC